jgi:hypothetical protein
MISVGEEWITSSTNRKSRSRRTDIWSWRETVASPRQERFCGLKIPWAPKICDSDCRSTTSNTPPPGHQTFIPIPSVFETWISIPRR